MRRTAAGDRDAFAARGRDRHVRAVFGIQGGEQQKK
jgi:hypothetical protein